MDLLIGDIFGVGAFILDNHGALGVFDISIRAAFVGVCDTYELTGVFFPVVGSSD
jgi:hypothetical protein